ncbi:hypothetical protein QBC34DRAFT_377934 [Podospora aff. communis PSN243]|uniref:Uncharacterized protein n=1 Tax=Podospora aff. communis PSN243 TaxID=3040156 RepID=A0AAV9GVM6_9PEZI|nr:hypothetical protein QBC34DRAFT_377934 [Podospora aff. communis PSN243]
MVAQFGSAANETTWHPEPGGRGTYGLVSSCIITMALCVWTAVHLNVPEQSGGHNIKYMPSFKTLRKLRWLSIGLFAPEIVTWTAFEQYRSATAIYHEVNEVLGAEKREFSWLERLTNCIGSLSGAREMERQSDLESSSEGDAAEQTSQSDKGIFGKLPEGGILHPDARKPRRNKWTMAHSYYATMGGFVFDSRVLGDGTDLPRATLTARHLIINDKSKASPLAKAITTFQTCWFVAHCLSRLVMGMTVSILELNTFSHALCALVAYCLWWQKPLDIEEPTRIEGFNADLACIYMCMRTKLFRESFQCSHSKSKLYFAVTSREARPSAVDPPSWYKSPSRDDYSDGNDPESQMDAPNTAPLPQFSARSTPPVLTLHEGDSLFGFHVRRLALQGHEEPIEQDTAFILLATDIRRLQLLRECYAKYLTLENLGFPKLELKTLTRRKDTIRDRSRTSR